MLYLDLPYFPLFKLLWIIAKAFVLKKVGKTHCWVHGIPEKRFSKAAVIIFIKFCSPLGLGGEEDHFCGQCKDLLLQPCAAAALRVRGLPEWGQAQGSGSSRQAAENLPRSGKIIISMLLSLWGWKSDFKLLLQVLVVKCYKHDPGVLVVIGIFYFKSLLLVILEVTICSNEL